MIKIDYEPATEREKTAVRRVKALRELRDGLLAAFTWEEAEGGYEFWNDVYERLEVIRQDEIMILAKGVLKEFEGM